MFFAKCSKITEAGARLYMRQTALSAAVIQARFLLSFYRLKKKGPPGKGNITRAVTGFH